MNSINTTFYATKAGPFVRTLPIKSNGITPGVPYILEQRDGNFRNYSKNGVVSDWSGEGDEGFEEFCRHGIKHGLYIPISFPSNFTSRSLGYVEFPDSQNEINFTMIDKLVNKLVIHPNSKLDEAGDAAKIWLLVINVAVPTIFVRLFCFTVPAIFILTFWTLLLTGWRFWYVRSIDKS